MKRKFILLLAVVFGILIAGIYLFSQNKANAPADLGPDNQIAVKVYFGNSFLNPEAQDCSLVYPVERKIAKTQAVGRTALEELLKGPTEAEKQAGYFTSINSGVQIQDLVIEDGIAKADFNDRLEFQVGGSCRVQAIRAEITETLKQFPTVSQVIISINKETELILQP
ncbi:MAG: GerMN domain-containing protein [Patescibacteria group bacterium]